MVGIVIALTAFSMYAVFFNVRWHRSFELHF